MLKRVLKRYFSDAKANVAITFALASVGMVAAGGGAVDYMSKSKMQAKIQGVADAAAIDGARQFQLSGSQTTQANQVQAVAMASAQQSNLTTSNSGTSNSGMSVSVTVVADDNRVDVVVTDIVRTPFLQLLGLSGSQKVVAKASARTLGGLPLCVLALDETTGRAIAASSSGKLTAAGCTVQANSNSQSAIEAWGQSIITAGTTCAVGGVQGGLSNYIPAAVSDCPATPDPLISRITPPVGGCDFTDKVISGKTIAFLQPGVYCGGLKITGQANVGFLPGIYVMKDGELEVSGNARAAGLYVGFYFTGAGSFFRASGRALVYFTAPKDGIMAGMLLQENPKNPGNEIFGINSPNVKKLVGTIYLPNSEFRASISTPGGGKVADESAFTVIVAKKLTINADSNLILNTDYAATDVPLPSSIANLRGQIVLSK